MTMNSDLTAYNPASYCCKYDDMSDARIPIQHGSVVIPGCGVVSRRPSSETVARTRLNPVCLVLVSCPM